MPTISPSSGFATRNPQPAAGTWFRASPRAYWRFTATGARTVAAGAGRLEALLLVRVGRAEHPFWGPAFTDDNFREPTVAVSADRILQASNFLLTAFDRDGNMAWQARLDIQSEPYDPQCDCCFR